MKIKNCEHSDSSVCSLIMKIRGHFLKNINNKIH